MNKYEVYRKAIDKWGKDLQLTICMEECAELIKAVSKYKRGGPMENVMNEMTDVQIMLEQMKQMFRIPSETWTEIKDRKLNILEQRVNND